MGKLLEDQNSLIMLSLDLPTPTHFTEMRFKRERARSCDWQVWQSEEQFWLEFLH